MDGHRDIKRKGCGWNDTVPRVYPYHGYKMSGYDHAQHEFDHSYPERHRGLQRSPRHMTFRQCNPKHKTEKHKYWQVPWNGVIQFFTVNADY
jgi:hypothetical protein